MLTYGYVCGLYVWLGLWMYWMSKITQGNKCRGCYTTTGIYYCFTDISGKTWESCEKCLDKVRKIRNDELQRDNTEL